MQKIKKEYILLGLFVVLSIICIEYPGMYMDAVNPDYLAARILNYDNIDAYVYPDNLLSPVIYGEWYHGTILNSLYGIALPAYIEFIFMYTIGYSIFTFRITHILYGTIIVLEFYGLCKSLFDSEKKAFWIGMLLVTNPMYVFVWRTQYYLQLFPLIFFLPALRIQWELYNDIRTEKSINYKKLWISNLLVGLASACYFVFAIYYLVEALILITLCVRKKFSVKNGLSNAIIPFLLGYSPYLFAHVSLIKYYGFEEYIKLIKSLDSMYGISDGRDSLYGRLEHIYSTISSYFGGEWLIGYLTGENLEFNINNFICIIFGIVYIAGLLIVIFNIKNQFDKKCIMLFILSLMVISHLLFGVIMGNSLGYQHYIMLLPFFYLIFFICACIILQRVPKYKILLICIVMFFMISRNGYQIVKGYSYINSTGGINFYSSAITDLAYYYSNKKNSIMICPQWGYWMPVALISGGENKVWNSTDSDVIINRLIGTNEERCYLLVSEDEYSYSVINVNRDEELESRISNETQYMESGEEILFYDKSGKYQFKLIEFVNNSREE